ncbi:MAG: hypothetical protein ACQESC_02830 [Nanobdellota archaeon]
MGIGKIITFDGHDNVGKSSLISYCQNLMINDNNKVNTYQTINHDFKIYRENMPEDQKNPWFYLSAWLVTENQLKKDKFSFDYLLVDRSYFSTQVLSYSLGIEFPEFMIEKFLIPDLPIQVKVNESVRLKRMAVDLDISYSDKKSMDTELIKRADYYYAQLGLRSFNNDKPLKESAIDLYELIKKESSDMKNYK